MDKKINSRGAAGKKGTTLSKILKRQENTKKGSECLYDQIIEILKQNIEKHNIVKDCEIW